MSTHRLSAIRRPVRAVEDFPGGSTVHVRDLSLAELRTIDDRADAPPLARLPMDERDKNVRRAVLIAAYALAEADGSPMMPEVTEQDLDDVEIYFSTSQIEALGRAAIVTKADAKNG